LIIIYRYIYTKRSVILWILRQNSRQNRKERHY